nr:hypothetical protein [Bacteroidota bacterium]
MILGWEGGGRDVNGDDDYYNEFGKLIYQTATGTKSFVVKQTYFNAFIRAEESAHKNANPEACLQATKTFENKSVEIINNVQNSAASKLLDQFIYSSYKDGTNMVEQNALIVLNIIYSTKGEIIDASINLEEQNIPGATWKESGRRMITKGDVCYSQSGGSRLLEVSILTQQQELW